MKNRDTTLTELREAIAGAAAHPGTRGVPLAVRRQVLEFVAAEKKVGSTARATAAALGVHETTLCRWARDPSGTDVSRRSEHRGPPFRAVQVAEQTRALVRDVAMGRPTLRVAHAASGLVIDGLDIETLVSLLRSLS